MMMMMMIEMMLMMIMGTSSDDDDDFISLHTTYRLDQLQTVHRRVHVRTQRHALSQPHLHPSHEQGTTTAIIHLSIYLSIYLSGHLTYLPIYLSILPSSSSFIDPSIYPFIQSSIHLSTHLSHLPIYHIHPSIYPGAGSTHPHGSLGGGHAVEVLCACRRACVP